MFLFENEVIFFQSLESLYEGMSSLTATQKSNIIVYDTNANAYTTFSNSTGDFSDSVQKSLCQHIQFMLEERVISVFETIEALVCKFIPSVSLEILLYFAYCSL